MVENENNAVAENIDDLEIERVACEAEEIADIPKAAEEAAEAAEADEVGEIVEPYEPEAVDNEEAFRELVKDEENKTRSSKKGKGKKGKGKKNVGKEILSWFLTFAIAFLAAIIINAYFFRISKVSGDSMQQTFTDGQTVFISRVPYLFSEPKYGDVVVFDHDQVHRNIFVEIKESVQYNIITMSITKKNYSHKYWIKRVIGVPGDVIEIQEDGVYRNGARLTEDYVNPAEIPDYSRYAGKKWVVGEGQLFVMGDNRNHSSDSRAIGLITINSVLGKVLGQ